MNKINILCNQGNCEVIFRRKPIINPITDSFGGINFRKKGKLYLVFMRYFYCSVRIVACLVSNRARIFVRFATKKFIIIYIKVLFNKWYFILQIRVKEKVEYIEETIINNMLFVYSANQQYLNLEAAHFLCLFQFKRIIFSFVYA